MSTTCPKCARVWVDDCEQATCVRCYGECMCCRFLPPGEANMHGSASGTIAELDGLAAARPDPWPLAVVSAAVSAMLGSD